MNQNTKHVAHYNRS